MRGKQRGRKGREGEGLGGGYERQIEGKDCSLVCKGSMRQHNQVSYLHIYFSCVVVGVCVLVCDINPSLFFSLFSLKALFV